MNKKRLFIVITIILVIIILFGSYISSIVVRNQLTANLLVDYKKQELVVAQEAANTIQSSLQDITQQLYLIAEEPDIKNADTIPCNNALKSIYLLPTNKLANIGRVNAIGYFACTLNTQLLGEKADALGVYIDDIFGDPLHAPVMSRAVKPKGSSSYLVAIHVPVYTKDHVFDGTLGGAISLHDLQKKFLNNITFGKGGYLIVLDDDGTILYSPTPNSIGTKLSSSSAGLIFRHMISQAILGKTGTETYILPNTNQEKVASYVPITLAAHRHWIIVATIPTQSIYATLVTVGINTIFTNFILLLGIIVIIVAGIFIIIMFKAVFDPLEEITRTVEQVEKGDLSAKILIKGSDEFGKLAQIFNSMTANVQTFYSTLEEKVTAKTGELTQKLEELENTKKATLNILEDLEEEKIKVELERSKDDAILSSIFDALIVLDINGKVVFANASIEKLLGWKIEELVGQIWTNMIPIRDEKGDSVPLEKRPFVLALSHGTSTATTEFIYVRKDGQNAPVYISTSPVVTNGKISGAIEVLRDITREREIDRMKTEFISLASHQLRTPLSAMKWFLEMLLHGDVGIITEEQKEMITNIDESNERMIELVNSLLNVSRIESGHIIIEPMLTDMAELLDSVQKEIAVKIKEKSQQLVITVQSDLPKVNLDPKLIRQVYLNLLTNAIKYTPQNGEISILVSKKDDMLLSQVSDTGYGIPEKDKDKVFNKFYRGENIIKKVTDGNGLGLYLVKAIIESSAGKIWFESIENKGTTFLFSIPMSGMAAKKGEVTLTG